MLCIYLHRITGPTRNATYLLFSYFVLRHWHKKRLNWGSSTYLGLLNALCEAYQCSIIQSNINFSFRTAVLKITLSANPCVCLDHIQHIVSIFFEIRKQIDVLMEVIVCFVFLVSLLSSPPPPTNHLHTYS